MANKKEDELENEKGQAEAVDSAESADAFSIDDAAGLGVLADEIDKDSSEGNERGDNMNAAAPPENYHPEDVKLERDEMTEAERQSVPSQGQGAEAQNAEQNQQWKAWGAGIQERTSNEQTAELPQGQEQGEGEETGKDNDSALQAQRHQEAHRQADEAEQAYSR
jgi:hypothetical protein